MFHIPALAAILLVHCVQSNPIFGGTDVGTLTQSNSKISSIGQELYPFMVHLKFFVRYSQNGEKKFICEECGGVLLTEDAILTAAHCLTNSISNPNINVRAGFVHQHYDTSNSFWVTEYAIHEDFKDSLLTTEEHSGVLADLAIVWLEKPFVLDRFIQIAIFPSLNSENINRKSVEILGWGLTENKKYSNMLKKGITRVLPLSECNKNVNYLDTYCTLSDNRNVSSCTGDSGGPLVKNGIVYGISTFGLHTRINNKFVCNPIKPDYFVSIDFHRNWLNDQLTSRKKSIPSSLKGQLKQSSNHQSESLLCKNM